ncbi:GyrI-like domain-containing protein [Pseudarthrobacter sp. RMG13]|uniref:GyrI-like domain-containing protein n=1 Tax=Pseudarthrobacter humi TaxID=2952523 RepID=A0ABT1LN43_9MICC|nr:GyrI-like domain-containing protein [Pseudarthrobacter humi]MCP8999279.1 GyrI-like domain-containing protein [Pseudarthrobacter humi]
MDKYDVKKQFKDLYAPRARDFEVVTVPPLSYLMLDGQGNPGTAPAYAAALEALYSVSYAVKFASKHAGRDYVVAPLEGLWTADDPDAFTRGEKDSWKWTMMIHQPGWIGASDVQDGIAEAAAKNVPGLDLLRLETLDEGLSVQILHIGSYDDEAPTLRRLHNEYMPANGFGFAGLHHEIYLSDARRVAPEKLKTILRQPVRRF